MYVCVCVYIYIYMYIQNKNITKSVLVTQSCVTVCDPMPHGL